MITGRNPWRYATADDDCFAAYLHDNDFLREVLPISEGINVILKKIFTINPLRRISLPSLRDAILELNAFFIDDSPDIILEAPGHKVLPPPPPPDNKSAEITLVSVEDSPSNSECSDERYVFASPVVDHYHPPVKKHSPAHCHNVGRARTSDNFVIGGSDDSLSVPSFGSSGILSEQESKGPITPATYAVDPVIEVPDIPAEDGLGEPANLADPAIIGSFKAPDHVKEKKTKGHLFRSAVQRLRGLSPANT